MSEMVFPVRFDAETGARVRRHAERLKQPISVAIRNAIMREIEGSRSAPQAPPANSTPRAPSDAGRLRSAMTSAGLGVRATARAADLGHHTTVSHVLSGRLALEAAGNGSLLAWVVSVERAQ